MMHSKGLAYISPVGTVVMHKAWQPSLTYFGMTDWTGSPNSGGKDNGWTLKKTSAPKSVWQIVALPPRLGGKAPNSSEDPWLPSDLLSTKSPWPLASLFQEAHPRPGSGPHLPALWPPFHTTGYPVTFLYLFRDSSFQRTIGKAIRRGRGRLHMAQWIRSLYFLLPFKTGIKITYVINLKYYGKKQDLNKRRGIPYSWIRRLKI